MLQLTYKFAIWFFVQLDFYTRFMKAHVECKVGLRAFEKLKFYYVRRLKEHNTCACKYRTEMVELKHGFNNMQTTSKGVHDRACNCNCDVYSRNIPRHCIVECTKISSFTDTWNSILCLL